MINAVLEPWSKSTAPSHPPESLHREHERQRGPAVEDYQAPREMRHDGDFRATSSFANSDSSIGLRDFVFYAGSEGTYMQRQ